MTLVYTDLLGDGKTHRIKATITTDHPATVSTGRASCCCNIMLSRQPAKRLSCSIGLYQSSNKRLDILCQSRCPMRNSDTVVIGPFRIKTDLKRALDRIIRERSKNPETEITLNRIGEIETGGLLNQLDHSQNRNEGQGITKVNCDNAAFEDMEQELKNVLTQAVAYVTTSGRLEANLYDSNGNSVGTVKVTN
jgi:hypothetical protein